MHKGLDKKSELSYPIPILYNRASQLRRNYRKGNRNEAHISAAQYEEEDDAWFSKADEHEEWANGSEKEESERKKAPYGLIVRWCRMASRKLRSNTQFRLVYSEGVREAGKKVVIYYLKRSDDGIHPGFVASRRIGKACQRNRAKRLMREIFGRIETRISARNLWIVFIASFRPTESTFQEILEDVEGSLTRAGLLSPNG